jgi:Txe/YoeB family toxin of Txe-Axe toxin-antitoxin module
MTGFTTNDFRNLEFYYQAPLDAKDGSEAIIEIVESNEFKGEKIPEPLATHHQRIVQ